MDRQRETAIYKEETWMPGKPRVSVSILHKICIKTACAFPRIGRRMSLVAQFQESLVAHEPGSSVSWSHVAQEPCNSVSRESCSSGAW